MTLTQILVFAIFALLVGWVVPRRWRGWIILGSSVAGIYWLQPSTPIRNFDFWFPTASIGLTVFVWAVSQPPPEPGQQPAARETILPALVILGVILSIGLTRYLEPLCCLTPSRPPDLMRIILAVSIGSVAAAIPTRFFPRSRILPAAAILILAGLFVFLKAEGLAQAGSAWLRAASGQPADLASAVDLRWLGFSYLAFRLLHALRDSQAGTLPRYSIGEFVAYAIFFPSYTAGPIDRSQRWIDELRRIEAPQVSGTENIGARPVAETTSQRILWGGQRILIGVFKKFVLADSLALIALNAQNASQADSASWMWVLLYAYTLRIYFDFSGYTDIALGLGRLLGFHLPENFDRPYLRQNLTLFWNNWHMTLAQWFRAYFFNPVTRALRASPRKLPAWAVILAGQLGTMLLIGLWHGITWNFVAWGAWHGLGLFAHNRWAGWVRPHLDSLVDRPGLQKVLQASGWLLTFHYVALGWVWFALPSLVLARRVYLTLFGF